MFTVADSPSVSVPFHDPDTADTEAAVAKLNWELGGTVAQTPSPWRWTLIFRRVQ